MLELFLTIYLPKPINVISYTTVNAKGHYARLRAQSGCQGILQTEKPAWLLLLSQSRVARGHIARSWTPGNVERGRQESKSEVVNESQERCKRHGAERQARFSAKGSRGGGVPCNATSSAEGAELLCVLVKVPAAAIVRK